MLTAAFMETKDQVLPASALAKLFNNLSFPLALKWRPPLFKSVSVMANDLPGILRAEAS